MFGFKLFEKSMHKLISIWLSKWWVIVLAIIGSVCGAVGFSLMQPSSYLATTQVVLDLKSPDPVAGVVYPGQLMPSYMATQVDIIKSRRVALKVVDSLKLADNAVVRDDFAKRKTGGTLRDSLADSILKNLDVKPAKESAVITINFTGTDPRFTAILANAFAKEFINTSIEMRADPAKESATWFIAQSATLKENAEKAQRKLSEFQRTKGIVSGEERFDVENARLQELSTQLVGLSAQTVDSNRRQSSARDSAASGSGAQVQEVLNNSLVQSLKADVARMESRMQERLAILGAGHPDIVKLEQELASLRSKLKFEESTIVGSLGKSFQINQQRENQLRASYDAQRAKVLSIKQSRDELIQLQREYESAQRASENVLQRLNQTSLESQATQTNLSVLNAATIPNDPIGPLPIRNGLLAGVLGLLAGLGAAWLLELLNRKVRTIDDLSVHSGIPVISMLPRLPSPRQLRRLIATQPPLISLQSSP